MPTLDWIGKKAVVNHHNEVPFHLLKEVPELSVGEPGSGNLLVEGDNLLALKALLPHYAGLVKCIYIDPPYNTGNENWAYNDNVNSPEIRAWLGKIVGAELEDLSRHDKWLCMMYPRLCLLREMLREDGVIFVSIDDVEIAPLRLLLDEIFGSGNFLTTVCWEKIYTLKNTAKHFSAMHDFLVIYAKSKDRFSLLALPRGEKQDAAFKNPDNDPRGPWIDSALHARNFYSKGSYTVTSPSGKTFNPPVGRYWTVSEENFKKLDEEGRIWWGRGGSNAPRKKTFVAEVKQGIVPGTIWFHGEAGTNSEAKVALREILFDAQEMFITPKPVSLLERILRISTTGDDLVLDSFAGSATTGHAVLQLNKEDGGQRRFVLVELDQDISRNVAALRLRRACDGYKNGEGKTVTGLGGGFRYCRLGVRCFDEHGRISQEVSFTDLARHVYFTETGEPLAPQARKGGPLIGVHRGTAIYLLYNGVLKDKSPDGGNVLSQAVLHNLPQHQGPRVIYGTACRISPARRMREKIVFKQIPYEIRVR